MSASARLPAARCVALLALFSSTATVRADMGSPTPLSDGKPSSSPGSKIPDKDTTGSATPPGAYGYDYDPNEAAANCAVSVLDPSKFDPVYMTGAGQGVVPSGFERDSVVVCPGEDWWLPWSVPRPDPDKGVVYTGYDYAQRDQTKDPQGVDGDYRQWTRGVTTNTPWKALEEEDTGSTGSIDIKWKDENGGIVGQFYKSLSAECTDWCESEMMTEEVPVIGVPELGARLVPDCNWDPSYWYVSPTLSYGGWSCDPGDTGDQSKSQAKKNSFSCKDDWLADQATCNATPGAWTNVGKETPWSCDDAGYQPYCIWADAKDHPGTVFALKMTGGMNGGDVPSFMASLVPGLSDEEAVKDFYDWCTDTGNSTCSNGLMYDGSAPVGPLPWPGTVNGYYHTDGKGQDTSLPAYSDEVGKTLDNFMYFWNELEAKSYRPWDRGSGTYATPTYFEALGDFYDRLSCAIARYDVQWDGSQWVPARSLRSLSLNGESGELPFFRKLGFLSRQDIDDMAAEYEDTVLDAIASTTGCQDPSGTPEEDRPLKRSMFLVNINAGGSTYDKLANLDPDFALGTHSPAKTLAYQLLQHYSDIHYDDEKQAYEVDPDEEHRRKHTDIETLHQTPHTWEQYRVFRFIGLNAVALGFNNILVTGSTIPSEGYYQLTLADRKDGVNCSSGTINTYSGSSDDCYFNWDDIKDHGAAELLEWMNKMVGRTAAQDSPEAYCTLVDYGAERPTSADKVDLRFKAFYQGILDKAPDPDTVEGQVSYLKMLYPETWGEIDQNGDFTGEWPLPHLQVPHVTHFGHLCSLVPDERGNQGYPALPMKPAEYLDIEPTASYSSPTEENSLIHYQTSNPLLNSWEFNGQNHDDIWPYEGRSTGPGPDQAAYSFRSRDLRFTFDNRWYSITHHEPVTVKVTFTTQYAANEHEAAIADSTEGHPSVVAGGTDGHSSTVDGHPSAIAGSTAWQPDTVDGHPSTAQPCTGPGTWQIEYWSYSLGGERTWTSSDPVTFDGSENTPWTATFYLAQPAFGSFELGDVSNLVSSPSVDAAKDVFFGIKEKIMGDSADSPDLVIKHVDGCHAAFLNVRAIKTGWTDPT